VGPACSEQRKSAGEILTGIPGISSRELDCAESAEGRVVRAVMARHVLAGRKINYLVSESSLLKE